MNQEDVKHLATLARIELSDQELAKFTPEMSDILAYVSVIQDIAGEAEGDMSTKLGARYNIFRADEVTNEPNSFSEALLQEMPHREGRFLQVKKILQTDTE